MDDDVAIAIEGVSKKYCKSLQRSMLYGLEDVSRNALGMRSRHEHLRPREFWAVEDANLTIRRGETVGLIGPNGSGKTTLLKMLNGIFWPDRGRISVRGRVGALIAVGAGFHPMLTGRENVYINGAIMGMSRREIEQQFDAIVDFAGIGDFLDTPVKHYSSGMFVRLGFAVAVHCKPDIMLVDEVLAVGDRGFQTKCFKRMGELRDEGTTFVVVSHNMHTVGGFVDWVALIKDGKLSRYDDTFEGIRVYSRLFLTGDGDQELEKLVDGGRGISFHDVELGPQQLTPGDSFTIALPYRADEDYEDVEIDITLYDSRDIDLHHQATNAAYGQRVDLRTGAGVLRIAVDHIALNGGLGKIAIAIWDAGRTEQLFWWRIPLDFDSVPHATGKNCLPARFEVTEVSQEKLA